MTLDGDQAGELFLQIEDNLKCLYQQHLFNIIVQEDGLIYFLLPLKMMKY